MLHLYSMIQYLHWQINCYKCLKVPYFKIFFLNILSSSQFQDTIFTSTVPFLKKCLEVPYFKMFGFKYIILLTILCNLDTTMDGYCLHRTNKAIWNLPLLRQISKKDENWEESRMRLQRKSHEWESQCSCTLSD